MRRSIPNALLLAACLLLPPSAHSQATAALPKVSAADSVSSLSLFLDCQVMGCDFDYLRTELTWINYVRDRSAAQVHVIATALSTGSGGSEVTLKFIGLKQFAGVDDTVKYTTAQDATEDDLRRGFTRVLKIGLGRYLLRTPLGANLVLNYVAPKDGSSAAKHLRDPWNFWVFSVGVNGNFNGESQSKSRNLSGNFSASRTTEAWKARLSFSGNSNHSTYVLDDNTDYVADSHSYSANGLLVRSLGEHFSTGATLSGLSSTQQNIDLQARLAPTLEYDFLKYKQYTTRRLVLSYSVGFDRNQYTDTTLFDKTSETLLDHSLSLSYGTTEPWGSISMGASASNYLADFTKNRLSLNGGVSLRIAKGLQFNFDGFYARVRDQITLPKSGATDEERLLRLRQLKTNYSYFGFFGLSYTFGSVFNNVVNPRMGGGGGMMMMCC